MKRMLAASRWPLFAAIALLLVACGGDGEKPAPTAPAPIEATQETSRTVELTALAVSQTAAGAEGSAHTLRVTVEPSPSKELQVSVPQSQLGGTGPMWEAAAWSAVALSTLLLGEDPRQYRFTLEPGAARIDGPSAGGLTTVGVLAAIQGDDVRTDAAMTGTINPDGSIGPVGGIPHKIDGAVDAGKTLVLVPASQRFDTDLNTQQEVDLVRRGQELGIEVQPVSTVFEAYEALTGEPLPRPTGTGLPRMPEQAFSKLEAAAGDWISRYQAAAQRFAGLPDKFGLDIAAADQYALEAENALRQGLAAVAYERAFLAAAVAESTVLGVSLGQAYAVGSLASEIDALRAVETRLSSTLGRLEAEEPRSATDVTALIDAYSNVAITIGYMSEADRLFQYLDQATDLTEEEVLNVVYSIADKYSLAGLFLDLAQNNLAYGLGFGTAPAPDAELVAALGEALRQATDANLAVIDSTLLQPIADDSGISLSEVQNLLLTKDTDFAASYGALAGVGSFVDSISAEPHASVALLGGSLSAWATSSVVVAKYLSLDAVVDSDLNITGFTRERALADTLDLAQKRAEELITLVSDEEPVPSLYYYENARSYREGDAQDKLVALNYNWQAALLAEALAYFTGAYD